MTTDASEQRLVHVTCAAMPVGRVSLHQRRWRPTLPCVGTGETVVPSHEPHMPTAKTSVSDPLRIAMVTPDGTQGRIGITLCPGKTDSSAWSGPWARDLDLDLDVIQHWGATALLSLIEDQEFDRLSVRGLGNAVEHRHMEWWHLPIPDGSPPGPVFETAWGDAGGAIRDRLRSGFDVVIHCRGGLGRAGTIAARLLVELGMRPDEAVRRVRDARGPGAIETPAQEAHVMGCGPRAPRRPTHPGRWRASGTGRSAPSLVWRWVMPLAPRSSFPPAMRSRGWSTWWAAVLSS